MTNKTQREIFRANLQHYMHLSEKRQADLVKDLGVTDTTASNWYNGTKYPRPDAIDKLAQYLGITSSDLTTDRSSRVSTSSVRIPVYGYIGAGYPTFADDDIVDEEEISAALARTGEYFGLRVKGSSMEPRILSGDTLIVRKQDTAEDGDTVICMVDGNEGVVKRLRKYADGIALISSNPMYDPMYFTSKEITDAPVRIVGVAVEVRSRLK